MPTQKVKGVSPKQIDAAVKQIEKLSIVLNDGKPALTPAARNRRLKMRRGGEKYLATLATLCASNGLEIVGHSTAEMPKKLETVQQLAPLRKAVTELLKMLDDQAMRAETECWQTATLMYSMLRPLARRDGNVAEVLAPMEQFFATGRRGIKKPAKQGKAAMNGASPAQPVANGHA